MLYIFSGIVYLFQWHIILRSGSVRLFGNAPVASFPRCELNPQVLSLFGVALHNSITVCVAALSCYFNKIQSKRSLLTMFHKILV